MPPEQVRTAAVSPWIPQVQTSGIFKLPVEILFEIFSYFDDYRRFIRRTRNCQPSAAVLMEREHVERSTVIRELTMTCWAMRDTLLPVLWKDVEGCVVSHSRHGHTYGLYDQCVYLLSNPTIAAYIQVLSVDLRLKDAPDDLMDKFIDTLIRSLNLGTLELLNVSDGSPVTMALERKCAKFPNIREMTVDATYLNFIRSCPNIENLTLRYGLSYSGYTALKSHGTGLKRVAGVDADFDTFFVKLCELMNTSSHLSSRWDHVTDVVESCPKLQEIGLFSDFCFGPFMSQAFKHLRRAEHLSVVEFDLVESQEKRSDQPQDVLEEKMNVWKRGFADVLKDSPSKDRKFLRWRIVYTNDIMENGELEVFPRTSL